VIAFNEEQKIEACLHSLAVCDQLLLIDSHSTDRTRELALASGARVIERDWPGYRSQREFAIEAAEHDWILFLDADEQLSPELARELETLKASADIARCAAYEMPFSTLYYGRYLRHGDWYPDRHTRLFDRRRTGMGGHEIHEKLVPRGPVGRLRGAVLHDSYDGIDDQLEKLSRYARLMADALHSRGRRGSWLQVFLNPAWRFVRGYVVRLGFLDGWRGLVVALVEARYVREKYLRLIMLRLKGTINDGG
jgi:glycosyltransferase involved in cell wall biosynthesis